MEKARIKVILSYQQVIFREGIHFILSGEEDFEVTGEAIGHREAFGLVEANPPDVVVLGEGDDRAAAGEIIRRIKRMYPSVGLVLIAGRNDDETIFDSLTGGVGAVLTPDTAPEQMLDAIRNVAGGRLPAADSLLTPVLAARALADFKDLATLNERMGIAMAQLSRKETEILTGIAAGTGIEKVESGLNLTGEAIKDQLRTILQKLVANDRIRTVITEVQRGLPSFIPGLLKGESASQEFLTRAEFNAFKDGLTARFKSLVS